MANIGSGLGGSPTCLGTYLPMQRCSLSLAMAFLHDHTSTYIVHEGRRAT